MCIRDSNGTEYNKTKNKILDYVQSNDWEGKTTAQILDATLLGINAGKSESSPFYWTNAIPNGNTFQTTNYTISPITTNVFDTLFSYDLTTANYTGILVYHTPISTGIQNILTGEGYEYTVATDGPRVTINTDQITLNNGDIISTHDQTHPTCLLYTSPSPRDRTRSRMPSSA